MELQFLGATGTVTGSKYLISHRGHRVLVDCGLFQGYKQLRLRNWEPLPLDPATIDAVVLTHAHIDHSGYVPLLVRNGFRGPIYCTAATAELCAILLPDSARLQEEDAAFANRHHYSKHAPAMPLYTVADAEHALQYFQPTPLASSFELAPGLKGELRANGHLLGSAMLGVSSSKRRILFSGDLGRAADLLMRAPENPIAADVLVVESTYGNRRHPDMDPVTQLGEVLRPVIARRGVAMIPSFAVGRAQALLYAVHLIKKRGDLPAKLPVYLNSPMAVDATRLYQRHANEHRLSPTECTSMRSAARIINNVEESKALNRKHGPMVIIAGSGMATGGRIVHHLAAFAPDPKNAILLTGYQAGGTRGASLLGGADSVKIHGAYVAVRAEVRMLDNLSAHADYGEILDWLGRAPSPPRQVFITHGEPDAADALRRRIGERFGWRCSVPDYRQRVDLDHLPA